MRQFAEQLQNNGSSALAALGSVGAQALYQYFTAAQGYIKYTLLSNLVYLNASYLNCSQYLQASVSGVSEQQLQNILKTCQSIPELKNWGANSISYLMQICDGNLQSQYNYF